MLYQSYIYNFRYQISLWPSVANDDLCVRVTYFIFLLHVLKFLAGFKLITNSTVLPFTRYLVRRTKLD
jgi:hypothetical protein